MEGDMRGHLRSSLVVILYSACGLFTLAHFAGSLCHTGISRTAAWYQLFLPSSWLVLEDLVLVCVLGLDLPQGASCLLPYK